MSTQKHILIVEDEVKLATLLDDYLQQSGYQTTMINDGALAVDWILKNTPDLILLDIMLPNKDGLEICREVRKSSNIPIIFVTAKVEEIDRIIGLEIGADDYVCKPFSPREVVARVATVLRRTQPEAHQVDNVSVDDATYKVLYKTQKIELTAVEFQLFSVMYKRPGQIFSRQQLMDSIYDDHRIVSARTIDSHIKKLRKKLCFDDTDEAIIYSVYGVGYKYEPLQN